MKNNLFLPILLFFIYPFVNINGQTLDSFLKVAFDNNPELKALQLEFEASKLKQDQVGQLPDPSIGIGVPVLRPETRLGAQVLSVSASQMFPWFGTLQSKKDLVISMSKLKYEKISLARLDIVYAIKDAYYNLYLIDEKQRLLKENRNNYNVLSNVTLAMIESGKGTVADNLRIQSKVLSIDSEIEILDQDRVKFESIIYEMTNLQSNNRIEIKDKLGTSANINIDYVEVENSLKQFHPLINQLNNKIDISKNEIELNNHLGMPSFNVGLDYSMVVARSDALPVNNGRDILIPKIMVNVPLQRKKYTAKRNEELLVQESLDFQKEQTINNILAKIKYFISEYERARIIEKTNIEQIAIAEKTYQIILSSYSSNGGRFDELLDLQNKILTYEMNIAQALILTHLAKNKVDYFIDF